MFRAWPASLEMMVEGWLQCNYFLKRTVESCSILYALLVRGTRNLERVLNDQPFHGGQVDEEVLRAMIVLMLSQREGRRVLSETMQGRKRQYRYV